MCTAHLDNRVHYKLAVTAPWQCTQITLPLQLDLASRRIVQLLSDTLVLNRELKFVRLDGRCRVLRVVTRLNHLAFPCLEDEAFALEIVDVTFVHTTTVNEPELEVQKQSERHNQHYGYDGKNFLHKLMCVPRQNRTVVTDIPPASTLYFSITLQSYEKFLTFANFSCKSRFFFVTLWRFSFIR